MLVTLLLDMKSPCFVFYFPHFGLFPPEVTCRLSPVTCSFVVLYFLVKLHRVRQSRNKQTIKKIKNILYMQLKFGFFFSGNSRANLLWNDGFANFKATF